METKRKLGLAALSLTAAATVLGAGVARAEDGDTVTDGCCIVIGPGPGGDGPFQKYDAPFHKIDALFQKVLQKVEGTPAFLKVTEIFFKWDVRGDS